MRRRNSSQGSARLARQRERQVRLYPVVHDFRREPPALAALEPDQPIALHLSPTVSAIRQTKKLPKIVQHCPFRRVKQNRPILHVPKFKSSFLPFIFNRADTINYAEKSKHRAIRSVQDNRR